VKPRRRARRQVPTLTGDANLDATDVQRCLDPDRFADLADQFFWEESFTVEPRKPWSTANGDKIYSEWLEVRNIAELARRYGKTPPTIRKARDIGKKNAESKQPPA